MKAGEEVTYFVQKTDYEEENPATGKVEKKIRVYVEDSKGELKEENGGKEACGHSVFMFAVEHADGALHRQPGLGGGIVGEAVVAVEVVGGDVENGADVRIEAGATH